MVDLVEEVRGATRALLPLADEAERAFPELAVALRGACAAVPRRLARRRCAVLLIGAPAAKRLAVNVALGASLLDVLPEEPGALVARYGRGDRAG